MELAVKDPGAAFVEAVRSVTWWCFYLVDAAIGSNDRAISQYQFNLSWNSTGRIGATNSLQKSRNGLLFAKNQTRQEAQTL